MLTLRIVHFDSRRIPRLRKIGGELRCLYEHRFFQILVLAWVPNDDVRAAVIGDVEPEIVRCGNVKRQLIVFPCRSSYQYFSVIHLDRSKFSRFSLWPATEPAGLRLTGFRQLAG